MRKIDQISLDIYHSLVNEYENNIEDNGLYFNIFGIFMHTIMSHLTNVIIIKTNSECKGDLDFPYVNSQYVNEPFKIDFIKKDDSHFSKKHIRLLNLNIFGKEVVYNNYIYNEELLYLIKNFYKYRAKFTTNTKCYLYNKNSQIKKLRHFIFAFCDKYNIKNKKIFSDNIISYIEQYISDTKKIVSGDIFISSSNSILENRINAAYFLERGGKVLAFGHGDSDMLTIDEPITGYGDISYCTHYITYGSTNIDFGKYNKPLKKHNPIIFKQTSPLIESMNIDDYIIKAEKKQSALYIPTSFSTNHRYGPFRDMDDDMYEIWQKNILKTSKNIYYKEHPSNRNKKNSFTNKEQIIYNNLKKIDFKEFNYIVIDYPTTSLMIAMASNLPILYFDLGLRNFHPNVLVDIKKRVFWVEINMDRNFEFQIKRGFEEFFKSNQKYTKEYLYKYSLAGNNLKDILASILND